MTDHPVIMSAPMVNATLREVREPGTGKTETRRLLYGLRKNRVSGRIAPNCEIVDGHLPPPAPFGDDYFFAPTGWHLRKSGDRLWVRENWKPHSIYADKLPRSVPRGTKIFYAADGGYEPSNTKTIPSIHMPRWASRLTLIVEAVKIERLQDITDGGAWKEGIERITRSERLHGLLDGYGLAGTDPADAFTTRVNAFIALWESIHGHGSWESNPWIVRIRYRPILANIDAPEAKAA